MKHDRAASGTIEAPPRRQTSVRARQNGESVARVLSALTGTGQPPFPHKEPRRGRSTDERREGITREVAEERATAVGRRPPGETSNSRVGA